MLKIVAYGVNVEFIFLSNVEFIFCYLAKLTSNRSVCLLIFRRKRGSFSRIQATNNDKLIGRR